MRQYSVSSRLIAARGDLPVRRRAAA